MEVVEEAPKETEATPKSEKKKKKKKNEEEQEESAVVEAPETPKSEKKKKKKSTEEQTEVAEEAPVTDSLQDITTPLRHYSLATTLTTMELIAKGY